MAPRVSCALRALAAVVPRSAWRAVEFDGTDKVLVHLGGERHGLRCGPVLRPASVAARSRGCAPSVRPAGSGSSSASRAQSASLVAESRTSCAGVRRRKKSPAQVLKWRQRGARGVLRVLVLRWRYLRLLRAQRSASSAAVPVVVPVVALEERPSPPSASCAAVPVVGPPAVALAERPLPVFDPKAAALPAVCDCRYSSRLSSARVDGTFGDVPRAGARSSHGASSTDPTDRCPSPAGGSPSGHQVVSPAVPAALPRLPCLSGALPKKSCLKRPQGPPSRGLPCLGRKRQLSSDLCSASASVGD